MDTTKLKASELGGVEQPPSPNSSKENVSGFYIPPRARTLKQLFQYTTVEHLLAGNGQMSTLTTSDTVETALQTLRDNNILSVPVYSSKDPSKFVGLVDTNDILEYFISMNRDQLESSFLKTKISDLIELSKFQSTPMVAVGTPLLDVLETLSKGDTHRVGVMDPNSSSLYTIVSQMSLINFIAKNISLLDVNMRNALTSSFMKQIVHVNNIPTDTKTHQAFEYLFRSSISAAAVVDPTGEIVDTISSTDIVGFLYDKSFQLDSSISSFLFSTRRTKATKPPIVCRMEDTFEYVVLKLASTKVHRLWVVDGDSNRYLGFVNLTSVLSYCALEWLDSELAPFTTNKSAQ